MKDYQHNKYPKDPTLCKLIRDTFKNGKDLGDHDTNEEYANELGMTWSAMDAKTKPSNTNDITASEWKHIIDDTGDYSSLIYFCESVGLDIPAIEHACISLRVSSIDDICELTDTALFEAVEAVKISKAALKDKVLTPKEKVQISNEIDEAVEELLKLRRQINTQEQP